MNFCEVQELAVVEMGGPPLTSVGHEKVLPPVVSWQTTTANSLPAAGTDEKLVVMLPVSVIICLPPLAMLSDWLVFTLPRLTNVLLASHDSAPEPSVLSSP